MNRRRRRYPLQRFRVIDLWGRHNAFESHLEEMTGEVFARNKQDALRLAKQKYGVQWVGPIAVEVV